LASRNDNSVGMGGRRDWCSEFSLPGAKQMKCSSITVVIFCWRDCLISESMGHHDSEIMDDGGID
jgi:hypothetical protein